MDSGIFILRSRPRDYTLVRLVPENPRGLGWTVMTRQRTKSAVQVLSRLMDWPLEPYLYENVSDRFKSVIDRTVRYYESQEG